jgi:hypothetical protein
MGRHRIGILRAALVLAAAAAGMGATASWAQGTGDAGNSTGAPGTLRGPRAPVQRDFERAYERGQERRNFDRGNVDRPNFDRGNVDRRNFDRRDFDRPRPPGGAPAIAPERQRPDFNRGPGRGPDQDGPRNWNGPGRDQWRGPDRRPDHRPDFRPDHRPDYRPGFRPDYRPAYRPPPRFHAGPAAGFYAWPPGYAYRPGPPLRRSDYYVYVDRRPYLVPPPRVRYYRDYPIVRPYGVWYQGYGRYRTDADAFRWLGLTAITLGVLDLLDEGQQRTLEDAQIQATEVPVGTRLDWDDRGARGSVQVLSDGRDEAGRYCRDFEQTVTVAGRTERAGGTACQGSDGVWEVIAPS